MEYYNQKIKIIVQDQQELFREGILSTLRMQRDCEIVAEADSQSLVSLVGAKEPDIVLMSVQSKDTDMVLTASTIIKQFPHVAILAISMFQQEQIIIGMLRAGIKGCLLRTASKGELLAAIRALYASGEYYSTEIINRLAHLLAKREFASLFKNRTLCLTERERFFLHLLCHGLGTKEISKAMKVTLRSVERKKEMLYDKVGIHNVAGLIRYAIEIGLYNPYEYAG